MSKNYDVIIDGKGYNFGTKKVRVGGVEYEQKDNEYPLKFIVENSDLMIMLENHCAIPDIHRKIVPKTGEHIAKMIIEYHGGWTPEVARLCDQKNTRTIIFIAEKPETAQLEIPIEEPETTRVWLLNNEYREMCYRHNKIMPITMPFIISDEPYDRICYDSEKVNEYTLPKTNPVKEQEHYDALRKSNNPQAVTPEPGKEPETKLKDFAKSLEVKTPDSEPQPKPEKEEPKKVIPFGHDVTVKKIVYKEVTPTAEAEAEAEAEAKPKTITPNPEKKTYKKTG